MNAHQQAVNDYVTSLRVRPPTSPTRAFVNWNFGAVFCIILKMKYDSVNGEHGKWLIMRWIMDPSRRRGWNTSRRVSAHFYSFPSFSAGFSPDASSLPPSATATTIYPTSNIIIIAQLTMFPLYLLFAGGSDSNKGKSKKWRKILQFPHISQCIHLKDKIGKWPLIIGYGVAVTNRDHMPIWCWTEFESSFVMSEYRVHDDDRIIKNRTHSLLSFLSPIQMYVMIMS